MQLIFLQSKIPDAKTLDWEISLHTPMGKSKENESNTIEKSTCDLQRLLVSNNCKVLCQFYVIISKTFDNKDPQVGNHPHTIQ